MRTYLGAKLFNQLCMHSCTVALHTHTTYITPHAHTMHVYAHMHIYCTHTHTHRHAGSHTLTHVYPFMGTTFVYMYTHTHTHTHTRMHTTCHHAGSLHAQGTSLNQELLVQMWWWTRSAPPSPWHGCVKMDSTSSLTFSSTMEPRWAGRHDLSNGTSMLCVHVHVVVCSCSCRCA